MSAGIAGPIGAGGLSIGAAGLWLVLSESELPLQASVGAFLVSVALGALACHVLARGRTPKAERIRGRRSPVVLALTVASRLGVYGALTYLGVETFSNGAAAAGLTAGVGAAHLAQALPVVRKPD